MDLIIITNESVDWVQLAFDWCKHSDKKIPDNEGKCKIIPVLK
jgi:hypothetical protein